MGVTALQTVKFKSGETILSQGEDGDTAFLIVAGSVEVIVGADSKAKKVGTLGAGDVFGEMSLIEPGPRSATVKAVTDTECVATNYDEFVASIQEDPARAVEFMKTLVGRLRQMNQRLADMDPGKRGLRAFFTSLDEPDEPSDADLRRYDMLLWPMI